MCAILGTVESLLEPTSHKKATLFFSVLMFSFLTIQEKLTFFKFSANAAHMLLKQANKKYNAYYLMVF